MSIYEKFFLMAAFLCAATGVYACSQNAVETDRAMPVVLRAGTYDVIQVSWAKEPTCLLRSGSYFTPVPCPGDVK